MRGDEIIKSFIMIQLLNQVPITIKRKLIEKLLKELEITLTVEEVKEFEEYFKPSQTFSLSGYGPSIPPTPVNKRRIERKQK